MIKRIIISILIPIFLFSWSEMLYSCSSFVASKKGSILFGKNYDFFTHTGFVVINPKGLKKVALVFPGETPAVWESKYGSITYNQVARDYPTGGMNEEGLVVECMWLSQTQYPMKDSRPAVMELQWIQYILDTCKTVKDVVAADRKLRIQQNGQPLHFLITDREGSTVVVEFISFRTYIYRTSINKPPVLTNSSYADCSEYLIRFRGFGGEEDIQKTIFSVDRFVRLASAVKNTKPTPAIIFSRLKEVSVSPENPIKNSYTCWSIVYDPVDLKIDFKIAYDSRIHSLELKDFSFDCRNGALVMDFKGIKDGNIVNNFIPLTTEKNLILVKRTFAIYKKNNLLKNISDMEIMFLANYPASFKCSKEK